VLGRLDQLGSVITGREHGTGSAPASGGATAYQPSTRVSVTDNATRAPNE
jgi:hypothetical protein